MGLGFRLQGFWRIGCRISRIHPIRQEPHPRLRSTLASPAGEKTLKPWPPPRGRWKMYEIGTLSGHLLTYLQGVGWRGSQTARVSCYASSGALVGAACWLAGFLVTPLVGRRLAPRPGCQGFLLRLRWGAGWRRALARKVSCYASGRALAGVAP